MAVDFFFMTKSPRKNVLDVCAGMNAYKCCRKEECSSLGIKYTSTDLR